MALGQRLFQWTAPDIIKGISSSDAIGDGGFSSLTDAVQLTNTPGIVYQTSFPTDHSTNLAGEMIASCEDPTGNYGRLFVARSTNEDGNYYSMNGAYALTQRDTDSTNNYRQGVTDMIAFDGEAYTTTDGALVRWSSIGSSNTFDTSFFSFNNALVPHPALVFNSFAYYGDGNLLRRQSAAGVSPATILTLAAGVVIVALGIDPGSGSMLISVIGQPNLSDTVNSNARVAFYDGFSNQVSRYVQVEDMVTAFAPTAGSLYAAYGQNLGLWNGSGITFKRRVAVDFDNTQLLYKQHFSFIGSTLLFAQKTIVMAFGPVRQNGDNVFYPALVNPQNSNNFTHLANVGQNQIAISFATSKFQIWDSFTVSGTSNSLSLYTNSYDFPDEVWIRRIRVIWQNKVPDQTKPGTLTLLNENGLITGMGDLSGGSFGLTNLSGAASAYIDLLNINVKVKMLQLRLALDTGNYGIRRIIVYGDPANISNPKT